MPGKVKVKIVAGRSLPVMDRSNDTTDAYVEVKLCNTTYKTDVCRKSLNPQWNSEWFRFEVDDLELQDEPLQIRLMDHDTYSANDAIGKVYLDLNPLLIASPKGKDSTGKMISGWIPVYDTMHGIRGEVNLIVKVELFSDLNKFRQSSCGVRFFFTQSVPEGYVAHTIHGFVEELVVNDDPEYQWIDKIRTPRASNEARQTLFSKLSGEVQRKVGVKALELGANAVIGYKQCFDLEGESGIVVRGIGTAIFLTKLYENQLSPTCFYSDGIAHREWSHLVSTSLSKSQLKSFQKQLSMRKSSPGRTPRHRQRSFKAPPSKSSGTSQSQSSSQTHYSYHNKPLPSSPSKRHSLRHQVPHVLSPEEPASPLQLQLQQQLVDTPNKIRRQRFFSGSGSGGSKDRNKVEAISEAIGILSRSFPNTYAYPISECSSSPTPSPGPRAKKLTNNQTASIEIPTATANITETNTNQTKTKTPANDATNLSNVNVTNSNSMSKFNSLSSLAKKKEVEAEGGGGSSSSVSLGIGEELGKKKGKMKEDLKKASFNLKKIESDSEEEEEKDEEDGGDSSNKAVGLTRSKKSFTILKRHRGSRKRDKFSTTGLVKRAGEMFIDAGPSSKERIREEFSKFVKRISKSGESSESTSLQTKYVKDKDKEKEKEQKSNKTYREPNRFFFRRNKSGRAHKRPTSAASAIEEREGRLGRFFGKRKELRRFIRSTSESHSLGQTSGSVESLPSLGSEPVFDLGGRDEDFDEDSEANCTSLIEMPTFVKEEEKKAREIPVDKSELKAYIKELGFDEEKPLKLYISSMDALLVYEPLPPPPPSLQNNVEKNKLVEPSFEPVECSCTHLEKLGASGGMCSKEHCACCYSSSKLIRNASNSSNNSESELSLPQAALQRFRSSQSRSRTTSANSESRSSIETDADGSISSKSRSNNRPCNLDSDNNISYLTYPLNKHLTRLKSNNSEINPKTIKEVDRICEDEIEIKRKRRIRTETLTVGLGDFESEFVIVHDSIRSPIPEELNLEQVIIASSAANKDKSLSSPPPAQILPLSQKNIIPPQGQQSIEINREKEDRMRNLGGGGDAQSKNQGQPLTTAPLSPSKTTLNGQGQIQSSSRSGSDSPEKVTTGSGSSGPQTSMSTSNASNVSGNLGKKAIPLSSGMNGSGSSARTVAHHGMLPLNRRSSESDLSTPPKAGPAGIKTQRTGMNIDNIEMLEFPFITIAEFPPGFIFYLGGTVTARSVKLLERITNLEEPQSRDAWWNEIRMEIRSHCRAFGCTVVLDYEEHTTMCDDVCVLSASGTAALVVNGNLTSAYEGDKERNNSGSKLEGSGSQQNMIECFAESEDISVIPKGVRSFPKNRHESDGSSEPSCFMLHIPKGGNPLPYPVKMMKCGICRKGKVPDIFLATIEIPAGLHITGRSCLIQAQVFRPKKDGRGEACAKEVSDSLPFLEYELHRRLINKLKVKGMNAIFGLKVQICLGDRLMVGIATGTAVFLTALPSPNVPIICAGNLKTDSQKVVQFQKVVQEAYDRNKEIFGLNESNVLNTIHGSNSTGSSSDSEDSGDDEQLIQTNKDTFVLEVDDAEDIDIISMLIDPSPPVGYNLNNIETLLGFDDHRVLSQQMFSQVWRCRIPALSLRQFTLYFDRLIRCVTFKLRRMNPMFLTKLAFRIELPEQDEMQLSIIGMAVGLDKNISSNGNRESTLETPIVKDGEDTDMIFPLDEGCSNNNSSTEVNGKLKGPTSPTGSSIQGTLPTASPTYASTTAGTTSTGLLAPPVNAGKMSSTSLPASTTTGTLPSVMVVNSPLSVHQIPAPMSNMRNWVEITPLSYIHGARIEKYLGNLNFFFIRETTSIRENGGLSGFVHNFLTEVLAIVRAHIAALGGNAMVSYFMTECALLHNPHKNQGQCVVNVGGDAVYLSYPGGSLLDESIS